MPLKPQLTLTSLIIAGREVMSCMNDIRFSLVSQLLVHLELKLVNSRPVTTTAGWLPPPQNITSWELFIVKMVARRYDTGRHTVTLLEGH